MHYRKLGRTGLFVSELCLGSNTFGGGDHPYWKTLGGLEQPAVDAIVARAFEGGINFIDTANTYAGGESESAVGKALRNLGITRDDAVIATKIGGPVGAGPNAAGSSRRHLLTQVEHCLRRLQVETLDLLMLHYFDPATPLEESLRALDDLVRTGKVRYTGCSNFRAWEAMKALGISERESLQRFEALESHWSLATRELESEILPLVRDQQLGLLIWGGMLGGVLTGKFQREAAATGGSRSGGQVPPMLDRDEVFDVVDALRAVAAPRDLSPGQVALAWLLHQQGTTSVLFGARDAAQVGDNLKASDIRLSPEELKALDAASASMPDYGFGLVQSMRDSRAALL